MKNLFRPTKKGMSLVELIVVIVIMCIILAAVIGILGYRLMQASDYLDTLG